MNEQFPQKNEGRDKQIIESLTKGDHEFFEKLGGRFVSHQIDLEKLTRNQEAHKVAETFTESFGGREHSLADSVNLLQETVGKMLDPEKTLYSNIDAKGRSAIFFQMLADEFPELGVQVKDEAYTENGDLAPDALAVHVDPQVGDKSFLHELSKDEVIRLLTKEWVYIDEDDFKLGRILEDEMFFPQGTASSIFARILEDYIKKYKENMATLKINLTSRLAELREKLREIEGRPLTDEQLKPLLRKAITNFLSPDPDVI